MQSSVDIVLESDHPTSKVASTIVWEDDESGIHSYSHINDWPKAIRKYIGTDVRIGDASGTVHAETWCLLHAKKTEGAQIYITDPPCPNCVKNMAEAGVKALYIDHKGFEKDFAQRRHADFESMSLRICEKAGISVHTVFRKAEKLETLHDAPADFRPQIENPVLLEKQNDAGSDIFDILHGQFADKFNDDAFAFALGENENGDTYSLAASAHPVIGYTRETMGAKQGKYSYIIQPLNRVLIGAVRHGLTIKPDSIYSSRVPTSRELVNFVGAGQRHLRIGDKNNARDDMSSKALKILKSNGILKVF